MGLQKIGLYNHSTIFPQQRMESPPSASRFFFEQADFALLVELASYLSPRDAMALARACRATAPLAASEAHS